MLCVSLDGKGVLERMDTCMCLAESLCCPPETVTTLLICYTPIQNKKRKLGCKLKLSRLPTDPTISSSVCFFISERRSSTQWEIKRFLCSRFRDVFLRNVLVNSYT